MNSASARRQVGLSHQILLRPPAAIFLTNQLESPMNEPIIKPESEMHRFDRGATSIEQVRRAIEQRDAERRELNIRRERKE
jgi:hypothetical protein